jgi:hypothetical protein
VIRLPHWHPPYLAGLHQHRNARLKTLRIGGTELMTMTRRGIWRRG